MSQHAAVLGLLLLLCSALSAAQPSQIQVAVVTDGPVDRDIFAAVSIEREIANVVGGDLSIVLPRQKRFVGDWTLRGIDAALDRALGDPQVDVVLTLGVLASHQAAHRERLPKTVIAPVVIDPVLQTYPLVAGASGRRHFTYVADFQGLEDDVRRFRDIVGFKHMVALVDDTLLQALPGLSWKAAAIASSLPARISLVPVTDDVAATLAAIPPDADAVFVAGLLRFSDADIQALARGLIARRLPSFSVIGRGEVANGLLMTTGGAERDAQRLARRIALGIQRIAEGDDAARFEVGFPTAQQLTLNMKTAQAIGFSPRWQDLADAEQLNAETGDAPDAVTLIEALNAALAKNPALAASRARLDSSADDVRIARSALLPSVDATAANTQIDADRASPLSQAEKSTSAGISLQQILYSERAWANSDVAHTLFEADQHGQRQDVLDTLAATANAYLDVLRAKSVEAVRRSNVVNTRRNLETARVREDVGLGGRSDHLRWQAQLARDKQDLLAAESNRRQAQAELARLIHRSGQQPFATVESGLDDPLALVANPRTRAFLDTPAKWSVFTDYVVSSALEHAPETAQAEAYVAGRRRMLTAAQRAYFVPDVALVSSGSKVLQERGVGSGAALGAPDDESWSVSLQFSFPLFTGRQRAAELSQARHEMRASEADRLAAADGVEARARIALHRTASSYPAIALSAQAAAAANENLAMVTDAYGRGAVSITDLIDAQDTALSADLGAADAKYSFLSDFVGVLRAMSEFGILLDPLTRESWLQRVEDWARTHPTTTTAQRR